MPASAETTPSCTTVTGDRCAACGRSSPAVDLGIAWPFDGRRLCRECALLVLTLPGDLVESAVAAAYVRSGVSEGLPELSHDREASLVAALVGPVEDGSGGPWVVEELGSWPGPDEVGRLHPDAARLVRGTALFRSGSSGSAEGRSADGPARSGSAEAGDGEAAAAEACGLDDLHRAGVLRIPVAARLEKRVSVAGDVGPELTAALLRRRPFRTPVPPEIDPDAALPDDGAAELSLAAMAAWRLRVPALRHRVGRALEGRARELRREHDLDDPDVGREVFVDRLGLPAVAWRDRLALLVSASNGLVPSGQGPAGQHDGPESGGRRFAPAPRPGQQDVEADAARKRRMLAYLLTRLGGADRAGAGSGSGERPGAGAGFGPEERTGSERSGLRLGAEDVDALHALYAPSLAPEHRGWTRLETVIEVGEGLVEKPTFTVAVPPDVMAGGLEEGAVAEIAGRVEAELGDGLLLVERDDGSRVPVAPGAGVLAELARRNDGAAALMPRVDGRLAALEEGGSPHPLCGCDRCLDHILRHLRDVFLLMPFRRSVRRIVYNFLLTHCLLRCRANRVLDGGESGIEGPDVPAVHWKTSDFARRTLERQRRLVREGQDRFRRLCAGEPVLESRTP